MKLCPYPFSRMQTKNEQTSTELPPDANQGAFFPCCPSWFTKSYWDMGFEKNLEDIWNGKAAVELRKRMYEGDYSFCNRHECKIPLLSIEDMADPDINYLETPISPENIEAIKQKNPIMPAPPSSVHLVADLRCNLKCPSCRPEVISNTTPSIEADKEYDFVHGLKDSLEIVKMASAGEVFYSRVQRNLLKSFNSVDFPKLKRIHIVSNGTLLNQKTYTDLLPGTSFIKDISISIDAGSKEVYEKLRGPYWEQVVSNLEWLGQLRKSGKIEMLSLNFTLVRDNYRDVPSLIALAKKNNVDRVLIQKYLAGPKQGYLTIKEQEDQSVHLPTHPEHIHMLRTLEMFKNEPILHTLLDIEGYEDKLEDNVNARKSVALLQKFKKSLDFDTPVNVFNQLNEILHGIRLTNDQLEQAKNHFEEARINLNPLFSYRKGSQLNDESAISNIASSIEYYIFKFQQNGEYKKAINNFTLLSFVKPVEKVNIFYSIATSLKELSRFSEAEVFFIKALEQDNKNNEYLREIAFLKKNSNDLEEANKYFSKINTEEAQQQTKELNLQIYFSNLSKAFAIKDKTRSNEALSYLKKALSFMPTDDKKDAEESLNESRYYLHLEMGFLFQHNHEYENALESFAHAKEYEPLSKTGEADNYTNNLRYYLNQEKGKSLVRDGHYENAIKAFSEAALYEPKNKKGETAKLIRDLQYYLIQEKGNSLAQNRDYDNAIQAFSNAALYEPEDKKGEAAKQINDLRYYLNRDMGFLLQQNNDYARAIEAFEKAKTNMPPENEPEINRYINESSYYLKRDIGFSLQQKGKYREAITIFEEALKHGAGDADLFFSLGISLKRQKNYSLAKRIFNKALANRPEHYWALMELGAIEFLEGNNNEALKYYHEAKKYEPADKKDHSRKYVLMAERKLARGQS